MKLPDDIIDQVKSVSLTDMISRYVKLKKSGREWVGLCPFHDEHTPSFYVHPVKGYKCFGCDAKGSNAIDFIMAYERKEFTDAVIQVAGMAGIYIDSNNAVPANILPKIKPIQPAEPKQPDYIPEELINKNLIECKRNNLYQFLAGLFGEDEALKLCRKYEVGASNHYGKGTTLFVQRDINSKVRQLKVMLYDPSTGKRCREQGKEPRIVGRQLINSENLTQCLFGEHLLSLRENECSPVAIIESEKTAVICSGCYPDFLWLATGGKTGCNITNPQVNYVLRGRELHLFPDVDGVQDWHKVASELRQQGFDVFVNDVMAKYAEAGSKEDIADLIVKDRMSQANGVPEEPASKYEYIHGYELTDSFIYLFDTFPQLSSPIILDGISMNNPYQWVVDRLNVLSDNYPVSGMAKDLQPEYQRIYAGLVQMKESMFDTIREEAVKRFANSKNKAA